MTGGASATSVLMAPEEQPDPGRDLYKIPISFLPASSRTFMAIEAIFPREKTL
ncbi:hypothetical protein RFM27_11325 [Mesorhizobium sp. VK23A]|uniref:Uncharacterized protein n=1 Tax=Mesorhizobium dulcispinae TaxID=3072316 RepID=A0ABU4XD06_9HYPH|nr:hypothetical protein [Mesorhizobium sp. VK23B]MDX8472666.1 hypothetical protein [Mesorhizobium sp. VK23A]